MYQRKIINRKKKKKSVEQRLNKVTELTSTTYEAVINLEHKFTKTNESIEQTNP